MNVHLATSANQVWLFADEKSVTFNGTISGTAYLAMTNDCYLTHNVPPNYGGTIRYGSRNRNTFNCVQLKQKGPWAQDVEMGHGRLELCFGGPADWAEIFPRRLVRLEEDAMLLATFPGPAHVAFNDGGPRPPRRSRPLGETPGSSPSAYSHRGQARAVLS